MKNLKVTMLSLTIGAFALTSCNKDKDNDDFETTFSENYALAESSFHDLDIMSEEAELGELTSFKTDGITTILGNCATITKVDTTDTTFITIDFGATNCVGKDGRSRRGKVLVTFVGDYKTTGSWKTIETDGYYVNDHHVEGSREIKNEGVNAAGNVYYSISMNGSVTLANGSGVFTRQSTRTREWLQGFSTVTKLDDIYSITGSASGSRPNGDSWTANITNALIKEMSCKHLVSGTIEMTPSGKFTRTVDFGSGSCDNVATVTINNKTKTIQLK